MHYPSMARKQGLGEVGGTRQPVANRHTPWELGFGCGQGNLSWGATMASPWAFGIVRGFFLSLIPQRWDLEKCSLSLSVCLCLSHVDFLQILLVYNETAFRTQLRQHVLWGQVEPSFLVLLSFWPSEKDIWQFSGTNTFQKPWKISLSSLAKLYISYGLSSIKSNCCQVAPKSSW